MSAFLAIIAATIATTNPAVTPSAAAPELNKPMLFSFLALFMAFVAAWEYARKRVFHDAIPRPLVALRRGRMASRMQRTIDQQQYHNN